MTTTQATAGTDAPKKKSICTQRVAVEGGGDRRCSADVSDGPCTRVHINFGKAFMRRVYDGDHANHGYRGSSLYAQK